MAWSVIPRKGPAAPCNPPSCTHVDCNQSIAIILADCHHCQRPIGFDTKFCQDREGRWWHFKCAIQTAEQAR